MTSYVFIEGFEFKELDDRAKAAVRDWLNDTPIDYEDDEGNIKYDYVGDWEDSYIQDHCQMNDYLFSGYGRPIHSLVVTEFKLPSETNEEK